MERKHRFDLSMAEAELAAFQQKAVSNIPSVCAWLPLSFLRTILPQYEFHLALTRWNAYNRNAPHRDEVKGQFANSLEL